MLTVLLATRNRATVLQSVLEGFCGLQSPTGGWKLVVVDNGSSDQTKAILGLFAKRLPLLALEECRKGKNVALNTGLARIEGDLAVLTDDDVFPRKDWLVQLRHAADLNPGFSIFGGTILPRWEVKPPKWVRWTDQGAAFAITDSTWQDGPIPANCIWGPNMAVRSNIFQSGIHFDASIGPQGTNYVQGGDTELTRRLEGLGYKAWHVQGAIVEHFVRVEQLSKSWVMRRAIRHGRGEFRLGHAHEVVSRKTLFGAPRYLYRELYRAANGAVRAWAARNEEDLCRTHWRLNYVRGQIQEARTISQERGRLVRADIAIG